MAINLKKGKVYDLDELNEYIYLRKQQKKETYNSNFISNSLLRGSIIASSLTSAVTVMAVFDQPYISLTLVIGGLISYSKLINYQKLQLSKVLKNEVRSSDLEFKINNPFDVQKGIDTTYSEVKSVKKKDIIYESPKEPLDEHFDGFAHTY